MGVFKKAAIVAVTTSAWGGWHHVEVHDEVWWTSRFTALGFVYSRSLTNLMRTVVKNGQTEGMTNGQLLRHGMHVFINPSVASLPKHAHLFGGNGCYNGVIDNRDNGVACDGLDKLPDAYRSLLDCKKKKSGSKDWLVPHCLILVTPISTYAYTSHTR